MQLNKGHVNGGRRLRRPSQQNLHCSMVGPQRGQTSHCQGREEVGDSVRVCLTLTVVKWGARSQQARCLRWPPNFELLGGRRECELVDGWKVSRSRERR